MGITFHYDFFIEKCRIVSVRRHKFDLCENCYDEIVKSFKRPIEDEEYMELL